MIVALSSNGYWALALALGAAAAVVVAILLLVLLMAVGSIEKSVDALLETAGKVAANTANIQLEATAPVLALIVDEAVVQDGYMNALTDGYGPHERHGPAGASDRRARGSRGARAGRRADPRAQGA